MCGLIGYLGKKKKVKDLIGKLKRLEYRGYDSSGIALVNSGKVNCYKEVGCIDNLEKILPNTLETECAVAHTRWATHGKPSTKNAHPHSSNNGAWTIVHNGIIENYIELKQELKPIKSDTDTAVVAELLAERQADSICDFIRTFGFIKGSYSIIAINKNRPNELFLAKNKSPLYVAECNGDYLVASDPICFAEFSVDYYEFNDNEFAHITNESIDFYSGLKKISKAKTKLDNSFEDYSNNGYEHFMLKEICEESEALERQVKFYKENKIFEKLDRTFMSKFREIVLIGCGTSYHASLIGANYLRKLLNASARAEIASEFIYSKPILVSSDMLFIIVSQSGETADTLMANKIARKCGATTIALTNVLYSTLAKNSDFVLPICAGPEVAVASTKTYICQLSALYMFSAYLKNLYGGKIDYYKDILSISKKTLNFDRKKIDKLAKELKNGATPIFIGKDLDYVTAMESALKLNEIGYVTATSYSAGELKHGYLALVEEGTPLFVFSTQSELYPKTINSADESITRGARRILITNIKQESDRDVIYIDEKNELISSILSVIPLQYLAYKISVLKGNNPDRPRNLAKSVTVE